MTFRAPKLLELTGGCNLRDLGGHGTADGRSVIKGALYRSGVLTYLTPSDHNCVARLKLRTIVDLRRTDEIATEPTTWLSPVRNLSWPEDAALAAAQRGAPWERAASGEAARGWMLDSYRTMGDWLTPQLRGIFEAVLAGEIPLLFHCAAGKDRTGFCAGIVLSVLGVPRETILDEFAFTNDAVDLRAFTIRHRGTGMGVTDARHPIDDMHPDVRQALLFADRDYLNAALDAVIDKYGTIEAYATQALGLDAAAQETVREWLLED